MLTSFSINNLRGLSGKYTIGIKPLTVFVGNNSSGKSTYLRFFSLMKQSLNNRTRGPILWYSPTGVDFGEFDEAFNKFAKPNQKKEMEFSFNYQLEKKVLGTMRNQFQELKQPYIDGLNYKYKIKITRNYEEAIDVVDLCIMEFLDTKVEISAVDKITGNFELRINNRAIDISSIPKETDEDLIFSRNRFILRGLSFFLLDDFSFRQVVEMLIQTSFFANRSTKTKAGKSYLNRIFNEFSVAHSPQDAMECILEGTYPQYIKNNFTRAINENDKITQEIYFLLRADYMYQNACENFYSFFSETYYIAPVRSTAERYYRTQNIAIDEVDSLGANVPMILSSMSKKDIADFSLWMKQFLGFGIVSEKSGAGHLSLVVERVQRTSNFINKKIETITEKPNTENEEDNQELFEKTKNYHGVNLADTGFGYSQILPILLQLWMLVWAQKLRRKRISYNLSRVYDSEATIVIEQPELHLHPELQGRLVNLLVSSINKAKERHRKLNVVIETHSDTIINQIGRWVEDSNTSLSRDDVVIYLTRLDENRSTEVTESSFDSEGFLLNWPMGFFPSSINIGEDNHVGDN